MTGQAADRTGVPLFRIGLPIFDRLGSNHITTVGYRATRDLIFQIGNLFLAAIHEPTPHTWVREEMNLPSTSSEFHILPS